MFGFHRRTRSLIPVKDLAKYEKIEVIEQEEEVLQEIYSEEHSKPKSTQLTLIYIIYLSEALVAASLQSQLAMLLPSSNSASCSDLHAINLRSLLTAAYALGSGTTSILWGPLTDRLGRRPVALIGLAGMASCCLTTGFATDAVTCVLLRFFGGAVGAAAVVSALTMIGDLCGTDRERAKVASRFPLLAVCGGLGQLVQAVDFGGTVSGSETGQASRLGGVFKKLPTLGGQIACGSLMLLISVFASILLKETLPRSQSNDVSLADSEGQRTPSVPRIRIVDSDFNCSTDSLSSITPSTINLPHLLRAPSLITLVTSFSLLSLHSSMFSSLIPYLSQLNSGAHLSLPCSTSTISFFSRTAAGLLVLAFLPRLVARCGQLKPYRLLSALSPALYLVLPFVALLCLAISTRTASLSALSHVILSFLIILTQHLILAFVFPLAYLLLLGSVPDAFSAGSVIGLLGLAKGASALAESGVAAAFWLTQPQSYELVTGGVWVAIVGTAVVGAGLASWVREGVRVQEDLPPEVLCWETCFEAQVGFEKYDFGGHE